MKVRGGLPERFALLLLFPALAFARPAAAQMPDVRARIVAPASLTPGAAADVAVEVSVGRGWHIQSHAPSDPGMVPTDVVVTTSAGTLDALRYPPAAARSFPFAERPLDVYEGVARFTSTLALPQGAAGTVRVAAIVSFQACSDRQCFPPSRIRVETGILASATRPETAPPAEESAAAEVSPPRAPRPGTATLDDLAVADLDGNRVPLDPFRGRIVVLDFWASWCAPCRGSFPFFDALEEKYSGKGVRVIGLTLEEDERAVRAFLDSVPAGFAIVRDPSGAAGEAFGVAAMPTTFLLDRSGRVAARFEGSDPDVHARLERAIGTLLAGKPLAPDAGVRLARGLRETGSVRAWRRGYLADPLMSLDGDPLSRLLHEHVHASKEGAAGDGGPSGGGCGCN